MTNEELDIAKTLAVNAYNDVLSPIAKRAGSTLEEVGKLIFAPIFYPSKILEQLTTDECIFLVLLNDKSYKFNRIFDLNMKNLETKNIQILVNELPMEKFNFSENLWIYKEHLEHLNLLKYKDYKEPDMSDDDFENNQNITEFAEFRLTEFGKMFCKICVSAKCYSMLNQFENKKMNTGNGD